MSEQPSSLLGLLTSQRFWIAVVSAIGFLLYGAEYESHFDVAAIAAGAIAVVTFLTTLVRPFALRAGNFWTVLTYTPLWVGIITIGALVGAVVGTDISIDAEKVAAAVVVIIGVLQTTIAASPPEPVDPPADGWR